MNTHLVMVTDIDARGEAWWRHQMETSSASLSLCEGNPPVTGGFPTQRPVTWSFDASIRAWTNGWGNNRDVCDLKRHRAQSGVTITNLIKPMTVLLPGVATFLVVNNETVNKTGWYQRPKLEASQRTCLFGNSTDDIDDELRLILVQCGAVITRSIFSWIFTKDTS